jgi:hypothetical protein
MLSVLSALLSYQSATSSCGASFASCRNNLQADKFERHLLLVLFALVALQSWRIFTFVLNHQNRSERKGGKIIRLIPMAFTVQTTLKGESEK